MTMLLAAILAVGLCVLLLGFNIFFRNKPFPDGEISHNRALREKGILCAKEEELRLWGGKDGRGDHGDCSSCKLYETCSGRAANNEKQ